MPIDFIFTSAVKPVSADSRSLCFIWITTPSILVQNKIDKPRKGFVVFKPFLIKLSPSDFDRIATKFIIVGRY